MSSSSLQPEPRKPAPVDLAAPELYVNRELSWLAFNGRVLEEGRSHDVPLMERLKFLSIVSSNLDEFFMIRVAGLKRQALASPQWRDPSGLTAADQLEQVSERVHEMLKEHSEAIGAALQELGGHGIRVLGRDDLTAHQREFVKAYFRTEVAPVLTPLAAGELRPFPALPGLALNLAVMLAETETGTEESSPRIGIIPIPGNLPRFISLPAAEGLSLARLEHVIQWCVEEVFPGARADVIAVFRITRDGDVWVDEDEAGDLLVATEEAVRRRRRRSIVRLELSASTDPALRKWLASWSELSDQDIYDVADVMNARDLMDVAARTGFSDLRWPDWPPVTPPEVVEAANLWQVLGDRDVLLLHPYDSFEPVVSLINLAADDPGVLAIKITLYRTSTSSPIVAALTRAADRGKQVIVLVELKARFDEERNVNWARSLEDAGCHVIYGIAGLKTHAKVLLIVRREARGIRRYVHCSTGNYNENTARLYSDIGLMTTDRGFALDAAAFFNLLTGYSQEVGWSRFTIAPSGLRQRFIELIERETEVSTPDHPGRVMAKLNSVQDNGICQALYRASQAGVKVQLNVRGICCLRPGIPKVSENIEVVSIVDRFLEHARAFHFHNGGHDEVYLSSADWMDRNLDRRLEVLFPVSQPSPKRRLIQALETFFSDNVKARRMLPDGRYERVKRPGPKVRAQEVLYRQAAQAAKARERDALRLRPLMSPDAE
ncbi:MAG: polyphosphate kinase 1 [Armatimonadota bacterium]|jgi:polyphosphate kinase